MVETKYRLGDYLKRRCRCGCNTVSWVRINSIDITDAGIICYFISFIKPTNRGPTMTSGYWTREQELFTNEDTEWSKAGRLEAAVLLGVAISED